MNNHTFIIGSMVSLDDLNDYFNINIENQDCDTINGFLIDLLGRISMSAEEKNIGYKNFTFKIEEIKEKRIEKIKFYDQKEV
ncbi:MULTISPECIES: transporter associated domain-containing protein [Clostridium]|nr:MULTISPECIES: transporter associated domain-containing protein [Clostridium]MDU2832626.1 transporter associated domain-containing protein [Clostridium botulinum]MDU4547918.1 transporter associated domain-containing protein [Clostridium botulinum]MDU5013962.1 transporter associated domain-containing protein [Clostridium botulinum]MDU5119933.1 transporter associated domain-containing protein [Clostridium botulinum]